MTANGLIRVGTSGWIYKHWRGVFYPADLPVKKWLSYYTQHFDTVEINNTFYRLPDADVFAGWSQQAPAGFTYSVKASRYLTHMKKLKEPEEPLENILGRSRKLGSHLGPVLYQLPPFLHCDLERLRRFIAILPLDIVHVFEFRDSSWFCDEVKDLLTDTGMNFCIHDLKGMACPVWTTGATVYLRFHGPSAIKYAGKYELRYLKDWADRIHEFERAGRNVFAYFNNDAQGHAVANACDLQQLLGLEMATVSFE